MKGLQVAVEVLIAMLAVVGLYSLWRLFADRIFGTDRLMLTVEILTEKDAKRAESLVREAMMHVLWLRSGRLSVLTTAELAEHPSVQAVIKAYGVSCRILREEQ